MSGATLVVGFRIHVFFRTARDQVGAPGGGIVYVNAGTYNAGASIQIPHLNALVRKAAPPQRVGVNAFHPIPRETTPRGRMR